MNRRLEASAWAPWPDFAGNPIRVGDVIRHPADGDRAVVVFSLDGKYEGVSRWRAVYENGESLWLGNQIGDKGRAVVEIPASNIGKVYL